MLEHTLLDVNSWVIKGEAPPLTGIIKGEELNSSKRLKLMKFQNETNFKIKIKSFFSYTLLYICTYNIYLYNI